MQVVRGSWAIVVGLIAMAACLPPLHAEPITSQTVAPQSSPATPPAESPIDLTELTQDNLLHDTAPSAQTANLLRGGSTPNTGLPHVPEPETATTLHSTIKETVRPVYNELVESGALETWHDVKESLGLSKNTWDRPAVDEEVKTQERTQTANAPVWQDPAQAAKSAAQTQLDREYDAYLLRQLIDDLKPWVLGLIGLYALGYLAKLIFNFMQWKAARRRERRAQRARHRSSRHSHNAKREL